MNIYIYGLQISHEARNQLALAKRTSKVMKNGQGVIIQMGSSTRCSGWSKHTLSHA